MCGIIAIVGKNANKISDQKVGAMLACLAKRGPDDRGFERFENSNDSSAILGQTRLSIVDLSPAGHQPMRDNTRPLTIVFNGEIYGYKDARKALEAKGHKFGTNSDTEVILKAYAEYGEKCVDHLDGMFAFALWDEQKHELFVARDRFGKKPFYYTFVNNTFYAASEIKSLFASGLVKAEINPEVIGDYLRLLYVPPNKTIYKNIHTLFPAHAGVVKDGKLETWGYWNLEKKEPKVSYQEAKAKIKQLFDQAVKKRMVADVEIGTLLSGGIDSTMVTLYAQKYSKTPIKTFSVGYEGARNELPYALEASKKIGTDHYTLDVKADLVGELEKIIEYMDEPHADSSNFPQAMISGLASSKVKVTLSGDGADELFMGYGWYQKYWHTPRWKLSRLFGNAFSTYKKIIAVFDDSERSQLLKTPSTSDGSFEYAVSSDITDPIHKINAFDLRFYLPGQLLSKIDRTSMMHSLEVRSPFLDTALAEYVYNLPTEFKLSKDKNKIILKDILAEVFPKEFVYRRKQGFGAPIDLWLQDDKMKVFVNSLLESDSKMYDYLNKNQVLKIRDTFYATSPSIAKYTAQKLWSLLCLALWFQKHR